MKITIIGAAGTLGSCAAFNIVTHKLADELVLIDPWADSLKGHCLDLNYAATGSDMEIYQGKYEDMAGTDIVVMAAGAPSGVIKSRAELLPGNLPIIKENGEQINKYCPGAVVITQTNPVDPLNYALYLMSRDRDRRRYIGYSMNDTIRFRMWTAQALGVASSRLDGLVLGEHGGSQVMAFSSLRLDGKPVEVSEEIKEKVRAQPAIMLETFESLRPKRTAGWVSAVGTVAIIEAIKNDSRETLACDVVLNGEYGAKNLSMSVPAVVGKDGIESITEIPLNAEERTGVKNTIATLSSYMRQVEEYLGVSAA